MHSPRPSQQLQQCLSADHHKLDALNIEEATSFEKTAARLVLWEQPMLPVLRHIGWDGV